MTKDAELHDYLPGVGTGDIWCLLGRGCSYVFVTADLSANLKVNYCIAHILL